MVQLDIEKTLSELDLLEKIALTAGIETKQSSTSNSTDRILIVGQVTTSGTQSQ